MPYLPIQVPIRFTVALVMLMLIAQAVQLKEISFTHGIENIIFYGSKRKIYFIIFPCNERRAFVVPQV